MRKYLGYIVLGLMAFLSVFFYTRAHAEGLEQSQFEYDSTITVYTTTIGQPRLILQTFIPSIDSFSKFRVKINLNGATVQVSLCKGIFNPAHTYDEDCDLANGGQTIHNWRNPDFVSVGDNVYDLPATEYYSVNSNGVLTSGDDYWLSMRTPGGGTSMVYYQTGNPHEGYMYKCVYDGNCAFSTVTGDTYFGLYADDLAPFTLLDPQPYSASQIITDAPFGFYKLPSNGTCSVVGADRIYVHTAQTSYVPISTDFTIDCVNGLWSYDIPDLIEGQNDLVFWEKTFIDESRDPVYTEDFIDTTVYLYTNQTWNPDNWSTTTTSTINLLDIPLIGDKIKQISDGLLNKIPIGYFFQIYDIWNNATTTGESTAITIDFSFNGKFPQLSGLEWDIVDLADPYATLNASTTETISEAVDWIDYILYFVVTFFFLNWVVDTYKRFINHDNQ